MIPKDASNTTMTFWHALNDSHFDSATWPRITLREKKIYRIIHFDDSSFLGLTGLLQTEVLIWLSLNSPRDPLARCKC